MGEAQEKWAKMKAQMEASVHTRADEKAFEINKAMYDLANDLTYPVDNEGNQLNVHFLIPTLSYHLARLGYRKHEDEAVIEQIVHPRRGTPGVVEDAVLYVPVDATGTLPEAFTRPPEDLPGDPVNQPWTVKTHITMNGETVKGGK